MCHLNDHSTGSRFPGLQQLISVALGNAAFTEILLTDPVRALDQLPAGVMLTPEERALVLHVRGATNLATFAAYLQALIQASDLDSDEWSCE